ncbi:unnamed protein product [Parajaminaea phylloscopi]
MAKDTNPLRKYQHGGEGPHWALVTGATNGMGQAWATQLASWGFSILLHGRNADKLAEVRRGILSSLEAADGASSSSKATAAVEIRPVVVDAGLDPPDLSALNEALALGSSTTSGGQSSLPLRLRVVINNVGITNEDYPLLEDVSQEEVVKMITLNATFPTLVARMTLPLLKSQANTPSLIVNVASLGAWAPSPYLSVYSGSKAYNLQFSRSLYNEMVLEDQNVDVVCMAPGTVISGMNDGPVTSMMPLAETWVQSAISSLAPSSGWFGSAAFTRLPPVIVPWTPHARGLKFLNLLPTSLGDKITRNFVRDSKHAKDKKRKEAADAGSTTGTSPAAAAA